jgi:flagellin-like protein
VQANLKYDVSILIFILKTSFTFLKHVIIFNKPSTIEKFSTRSKKIKRNRSQRAVSPVIATVILVAIAITISVSVAFWVGGTTGSFTKFETVEIQNGVCAIDGSSNWVITISLKNTGTTSATLTNVFVNDAEVSAYGATVPTAGEITTSLVTATPTSMSSGEAITVTVWIGVGYESLSSGTMVNVMIHSSSGMDFFKLIELI